MDPHMLCQIIGASKPFRTTLHGTFICYHKEITNVNNKRMYISDV